MLPINAISWQDVERLFLRLLDRVEVLDYAKLHGRSGQKQDGIDAFGRIASPLAAGSTGRDYVALQSKRVDQLLPSHITAAVAEFRSGVWAARSCKFYYATSHSLSDTRLDEAIVAATAALARDDISFIPWGQEAVSEELRAHPDIVDDFFGREWVRVFCGSEAADSLASRLSRSDVADFRDQLRRLYTSILVPQERAAIQGLDDSAVSNRDFVLLDVAPKATSESEPMDRTMSTSADPRELGEQDPTASEAAEYRAGAFGRRRRGRSRQSHRILPAPESVTRMPADDWLSEDRLSLLVGAPGAGKSSLLKFVTTDLLAERPQSEALARAYGRRLPIWLPFAFLCRHVSESTANSVLTAVQAWLNSQAAGELWPLIRKSFDDSRLLLIIDGLDEWADVPHAEDALALIETLLGARPEVASIVSCRPYALTRLPVALPWHKAEVAPLTDDQQRRIAQAALVSAQQGGDGDHATMAGANAASQTLRLLDELTGVPELGELARVPLFLVLLASVWQGEPLPPRRFDVYRRLVELLILKHPQMRRRTSRGLARSTLTPESAAVVFGAVAYALRLEDATGVAVRPTLRRIIVNALQDDAVLGYDRANAQAIADRVLALGEEEIGLLVSHGAGTIGFLHRAIFEELAGEHLATVPLDEQLEMIRHTSGDPAWRDVLLAMLVSLKRPSDVQSLLDAAVEAWPEDSPGAMSAWELLAESINAGARIPQSWLSTYRTSLELRVEDHPSLDHRARLLSSLTLALLRPQSDQSRVPVFKEWMRAPNVNAAASIWAFKDFSVEPLQLWRGLLWGLRHHDEEVQINAAAAVAARAHDLEQHLPQLIDLITRAGSTSTQAAALYALVRGWPDHHRSAELVSWARAQRSFPLRTVALEASVAVSEQTNAADLSEEEKAWLLSLLDVDRFAGGPWHSIANDLVSLVVDGDRRIADICLNTLRENDVSHNRALSWRLACTIFADDARFRDWASEEFETRDHPLVMYNKGLIPERWSSDQRFAAAVRKYLARSESRMLPQDVYEVSRLAVCRETRDELIGELDSTWPWWPARALLRDYPDDPEVRSSIGERLQRGGEQASRLAPVAVEVLGVEEAFPLLVGLVDGTMTAVSPYAAAALAEAWTVCALALEAKPEAEGAATVPPSVASRLLSEFDAATLAARCLGASDASSLDWASDAIVLAWPSEPKVLERASELLTGEFPRVSTVLRAYNGVEGAPAAALQNAALGLLRSLDVELREVVATILQRPEFNPVLVGDVLADWITDCDANVRRLSVIALATALDSTRDMSRDAVDLAGVRELRAGFENAVRQQLRAYGPDLEERRQAAWIAMLLLRDLKLIDGLLETIGEAVPVTVGLQDVFGGTDPVLAELIARNWDLLLEHFGTDLPRRIGGRRPDHVKPWAALATVADRHSNVADAIRSVLTNAPELMNDVRILAWIVRKNPDESALDACLSALQDHHTNDVPRVLNLILETQWRIPPEEIQERFTVNRTEKGTPVRNPLDFVQLRRYRWLTALFVQWFPRHELSRRLYERLNRSFSDRAELAEWGWEDAVAVPIMGAPAEDVPRLLLRIHGAILAQDAYLYRPLFISATRRRVRADREAAEAVRLAAGGQHVDMPKDSGCHVFAGVELDVEPADRAQTAAWHAYFFTRLQLACSLPTPLERNAIDTILGAADPMAIVTDPLTGDERSMYLAALEIADRN